MKLQSILTQWFVQMSELFYNQMKQQMFIYSDYEGALAIIYKILSVFYNYERKFTFKLNFFMEKLFVAELKEQIDQQLQEYRERLDYLEQNYHQKHFQGNPERAASL